MWGDHGDMDYWTWGTEEYAAPETEADRMKTRIEDADKQYFDLSADELKEKMNYVSNSSLKITDEFLEKLIQKEHLYKQFTTTLTGVYHTCGYDVETNFILSESNNSRRELYQRTESTQHLRDFKVRWITRYIYVIVPRQEYINFIRNHRLLRDAIILASQNEKGEF